MPRTTVLLAWIPLVWQPTWGQTPSVRKNVAQNPKQKTELAGGHPQIGTEAAPFIVETHPRAESKEEAAKTKADEDHAATVESWTLIFAGAAAFFTGLLVVIGERGVRAANRTLGAIEDQVELMQIAQRASVGITGLALVDPTPPGMDDGNQQVMFERSTVQVTLTNNGGSKALGVRLTVNIILEGVPGLITTPEDIADATPSDLHPNVPTTRTTEPITTRLPNAAGIHWQYALNGNLAVYGVLAYSDIFGDEVEIQYKGRTCSPSQRFPFNSSFDLIHTESRKSNKQKERKAN